jgi:hypothetical protein
LKPETNIVPSQPVEQAPVQEAPAAPIKFEGRMSYDYGDNKRSDVKANSTFDAILSGERTATTRYTSDGNLDYWKQAKVGDVITWKSADGRTVNVEVTKALAPLKGSGKTPEQWSKLEGWSVEYFNNKVRPKLNEAWQIEFKLIPTQPAASTTGISTASGKLKLRDGKEYNISDINASLLESIGYKPKEIGKLLKSIAPISGSEINDVLNNKLDKGCKKQ